MAGKKQNSSLFNQIDWSKSYVSLLLGLLAVVIAGFAVIPSLLKIKRSINIFSQKEVSTEKPVKIEEFVKTYTVVEGDTLWSIAEKFYGSGYNWADIKAANNLTSPDLVYMGLELKIPSVAKKEVTRTQEVSSIKSIGDSAYTVLAGDDLWSIALRAYGDGFRWEDIAKENNLSNPDVVEPGTILKIPR